MENKTPLSPTKIREIRMKLGVTQEEFARMLMRKSLATVSRWELGLTKPDPLMEREILRLEASCFSS